MSRIDQGRRMLNVIVAALGLLLSLPLMLVIAALVKLTSRGSILYTQTRVGLERRTLGHGNTRRHRDLGGKPFTMYKFRTMYAEQCDAAGQVWAQRDDPRVTPIGRVLRKYRLDELPQFINVLEGDMNIVGPRPEQPEIFATLRKQIPIYHERQRVLPGITGWAQINHCYDRTIADVHRKLALDLEYLNQRTLLKDLTIMLRTVPVMLAQRGGW
jgi:lipopolysaccharide/colanic/teichoic acid biosynthesis glycosyltransferase